MGELRCASHEIVCSVYAPRIDFAYESSIGRPTNLTFFDSEGNGSATGGGDVVGIRQQQPCHRSRA